MWTRKSTHTDYTDIPVEYQNFIKKNPVYTQHHEESTLRIQQAILNYQKTGKIKEKNICKIVLKMTNTCNLRCTHCFQWRENGGFHHEQDPTAIPFDKCKYLFDFVARNKPDIILTGGEATLHRDFDKFVETFAQMGCFIHICTNGLSIRKYYDLFKRWHNQLAFLISLDGTGDIHDNIRGKGTWRKTLAAIELLAEGKRHGMNWLIGVENTLMATNLDNALELKEVCEDIGVDWMIYNHLWVVDLMSRHEYIKFCQQWNITPSSFTGFDAGPFSDDYIKKVNQTILALKLSNKQIPVLFGPEYSPQEVFQWYKTKTPAMPSYLKMGCKLDIDIGGELVMTKQFPDLGFGSILEKPIEKILASDKYQEVARQLRNTSLRILNACPDTHNLRV
ncbi:4Fe-4S single cluster protein [Providencia alcalifaciens]|uniref:4Fe-4S single cluster protein n=1 Tax=Providencia alcalifaciens TaxID=126385 RepID=A0A4R3NJ69_9GAMM|nr:MULTISPECIES: radical SAM protein [Providencia]MBC5792370.1 radical SAM protein [Providencia sp. JUb39]TCT28833.1 4Fe-4S single cluster protein [Providencia alcalifaciens]